MNPFQLPPHTSLPLNSTFVPEEPHNRTPRGNVDEKNSDTANPSAPSSATLQRNKTLPHFIAAVPQPAPYTGVKIDGKNFQPGPDTLPVVTKFVEETLQNGQYDSLKHLQSRAENFFRHIDAERAINSKAKEAMTRPEAAIARQSAHMAHLVRGLWSKAELSPDDRKQLAQDLNQSKMSERKLLPKKGVHIFEGAKDIHTMFVRAEEGPLTFEQSKLGAEAAYLVRPPTSTSLAPNSDLFSQFDDYAKKNWVNPDRAGTHHFKEGVSLKQDLGSNIRDELGLPVMLGTSGSSSHIALATKFASIKQEVSMWPSDLTEEQGKQAMIDAVHHYMREQVVPASMKKSYDAVRTRSGAEPKNVDPFMVFAHSYPEVSSAIEMTLDEKDAKNENAMKQSSTQALERLRKIKAEANE